VEESRQLKRVIGAIAGGEFSRSDDKRYRALTDSLLNQDTYMLFADFASYLEAQAWVDELFARPAAWAERALLNVAAMGEFSADRTIAQYVERVWSIPAGR